MDGLSAIRLRLSHLLILAFVIRLTLFFRGVRGSDAYAYAQHAYNIAEGQYDVTAETAYYGFRYAVLLPTAPPTPCSARATGRPRCSRCWPR